MSKHTMRRKDREIPLEQAYQIVDKCAFAVISTVNADNTPYGVPLNIVREGAVLYFHCARQGQKADNFRARPAVSVVCVGDVFFPQDEFTTGYESAIICGSVREIMDRDAMHHPLRLLCERYMPDNMHMFEDELRKELPVVAVFAIDINSISGKRLSLTK